MKSKTTLSTLAGGLLLATAGLVTIADSDNNLLSNGNFERGLEYWQAIPPAIWSEDEGRDATGALLMNADYAAEDGYIYQLTAEQCIHTEPWSELTLVAHFRYRDELPEQPEGHRLNLIWYADENCTQRGQMGIWLEPELISGWQTLQASGIKPALGSTHLKLQIAQDQRRSAIEQGPLAAAWSSFWESGPPLAAAFWDDISMIPSLLKSTAQEPSVPSIPERSNYLDNPDFAQGTEDWNIDKRFAAWEPDDGAIRVSLSSELESQGRGVFHQCADIDPAQRYVAGIRYKRTDGADSGGGRLRLLWYELPSCKGAVGYGAQADVEAGSDGWKTLQTEVSAAAAGSRSVKFEIIQSVDGQWSNNSILWDEAYLKYAE